MTDKPKILLTGATGFIGRNLLTQLLAEDYPVLALARGASMPKISHTSPLLQLMAIESQSMDKSIAAYRPDIVIHTAWQGANRNERNDAALIEQNIALSKRLLEISIHSGCKRWIGLGSQAEYHPDIEGFIAEDASIQADNAYGRAKRKLCEWERDLCAHHGVEHVWLRLFTCYGKDMHADYLIPTLIEHFKRGELPTLHTPKAAWDLLHVDDAARALLAVVNAKQAAGIYNLASGKAVTVADMAMILASRFPAINRDELHKHMGKNVTPASQRAANVIRFQSTFNWSPTISHEEGLLRCL